MEPGLGAQPRARQVRAQRLHAEHAVRDGPRCARPHNGKTFGSLGDPPVEHLVARSRRWRSRGPCRSFGGIGLAGDQRGPVGKRPRSAPGPWWQVAVRARPMAAGTRAEMIAGDCRPRSVARAGRAALLRVGVLLRRLDGRPVGVALPNTPFLQTVGLTSVAGWGGGGPHRDGASRSRAPRA